MRADPDLFSGKDIFKKFRGARRDGQFGCLPQLGERGPDGAPGQGVAETRNGHDRHLVAVLARECHGVLMPGANRRQRPVTAKLEQVAPVAAQTQGLHGGPHLDAPVVILAEQLGAEGR